MKKTTDVVDRSQPNSFSMGTTKTPKPLRTPMVTKAIDLPPKNWSSYKLVKWSW